MLKPYLLHPIAVHFPIALLTAGLAAASADRRWPGKGLAQAASLLLWGGTLGAWAALGLGLLAENTAPHVPSAWEVLEAHETLAFWAAGLFTGLSLWRWRWREKWPLVFLGAWVLCIGVLVATAYKGGELVFTHGMGVEPK